LDAPNHSYQQIQRKGNKIETMFASIDY